MVDILQATDFDLDAVLAVERAAFGSEGEVIAELVGNLLMDPSARPALSLLAYDGDKAVGHILCTRAHLDGPQDQPEAAILAPLAVVPEVQNRGIGGNLIEHGLARLNETGVGLVFVLGHPDYYPRHGFEPAGRLGFEATYPILEKNAGAWMVQALQPGLLGTVSGQVICADALNKPEYWQE